MFPKWFPKPIVAVTNDSVIMWTSENGYTEYKKIKKFYIRRFLDNFGISYLRVCDSLWISLSYVKLAIKKNNWLHIHFYNGFTIHLDLVKMYDLQMNTTIRSLISYNLYFDNDAAYEIDSFDGTHRVEMSDIELVNIEEYPYVEFNTAERVIMNKMTLSDFFKNIKTGVIQKVES